MAITPARQRNAVSEGMALGIILNGHNSVPFDKLAVDLAFTGAWRIWTYASRFPQVNTDLSKGLDGMHAMTHASERHNVWVLYWDTSGRELAIYARQDDWDPTNQSDVEHALNMIDGDVRREAWESLARDFLKRMDR